MTTTTFRVGCRFVYPMYINSSGYNRSSHHTYAEHPNVPKYILRRSMASGRNHFITKGSNKSGITEEVRDLIRNVKHAENIDEWTKGHGIGNPIEIKPWRPNWDEDIDDDQHFDMKYFPHKDEENTGLWAERNTEGYTPPIVLLVERTKPIRGQPWYHKEILEKLGIGKASYHGKRVAIPNMSFYTSKLYQVKHMIKITPVTFPHGVPSQDEFDPKMAQMTVDGKFLYHPKIKEQNIKLDSGCAPDRLKIKESTYKDDAHKHWNTPYNSPLGTSNYSRDTTCFNPEKKDFQTDYTTKDKY